MPTTMIRSKVKYKKISDDDGYIDAQVGDNDALWQFKLIHSLIVAAWAGGYMVQAKIKINVYQS